MLADNKITEEKEINSKQKCKEDNVLADFKKFSIMDHQTVTFPFDEKLLPARILKTGQLTCLYEHGNLRYIRLGELEILRMIYFAVRDQNWQTASYSIDQESIVEKSNGFSIHYTSFHELNDIQYKTDVNIDAEENSIIFSARGEALSSFKRNRIGICVLHPIEEYSEKDVTITTPDDTKYQAVFPGLISPHQPFVNIAKMDCIIRPEVKTTVVFEGDVFETEDQRNWSDSSYKTYSTPVDLPFPVQVNKGETVAQKITLQVSGRQLFQQAGVEVKEEQRIPFPRIGYGRSNQDLLRGEDISLLKAIPFDHFRVELRLALPDWKQILETAAQEAAQLETKIELILFFNENYADQCQQFQTAVEKNYTIVDSILLLQAGEKATPVTLFNFIYQKLKKEYPSVKIGYGTDGFFADMNRHRPADLPFDFISFSLTPQAHATDTRSIMENLERQADIIRTARSFAGDKNIHVSPVTFAPRANAIKGRDEAVQQYDSRQHTPFGAFWTLSALKNLGEASLTFYQANGNSGVLSAQSNVTERSPLYRLLNEIKGFKPKWVITGAASKFFKEVITLENEHGERRVYQVEPLPDQ